MGNLLCKQVPISEPTPKPSLPRTPSPVMRTPSPPPTPTPTPPPLPPREPTDDDILKTSDFEGFVIEFEGDSDEIQVSPTLQDYPDPNPSTHSRTKVAQAPLFYELHSQQPVSQHRSDEHVEESISKEEIDAHARKAPRSVLSSYEQLIQYLGEKVRGHPSRDEWVVRSILAWLSNQVVEQYTSEIASDDTPLGYLSLLGNKRSTYSTFFTIMCRKANICCAQIHGVCKAGDYQPGDRNVEDLTCLWNAVYIKDSWQIVHPYWVCRSVFGKKPGGWIKLEESGQAVGQKVIEAAGVIRNAFKEYYIMPDPAQFIYRCHPDDPKWQLIPKPIDRERFLDQLYVFPPFWDIGLELLGDDLCTLKSKGSPLTISFALPKAIANEVNLDYQFLVKEGPIEGEWMLDSKNIPRLVSKIRNGSQIDFFVQCPVEGIYRLVIYGGLDKQPFLRLCEYKIDCQKRTSNCRLSPFDPGLLGFGPGPRSEKAGLLLPSHTNGLIEAELGKETKFNFLLDSEICHTLYVDAEIISPDDDKSASLKFSVVKKNELKISVKIMKDGDYGIRIRTGENQLDGSDVNMEVVCNYLVSSTAKFKFEKANRRNARRRLLASIESADHADTLLKAIESLKTEIEKCKKEKIPDTDSDILNAEKKLDIMSFRKDIHDAYLRKHDITTQKTIQAIERSPYYRIFHKTLEHLRKRIEDQ